MVDNCLPEDLHPRVNTDVCTRCRRAILKGHRIIRVNISAGGGINPNNLGQRGLFISEEWEFVHVDCYDPLLKNRVGVF